MNNKLKVRTGKTVHDDRGNVLGVSGSILALDAPVRESDRCKLLLVNMDATDAFIEPDEGRTIGVDVGVPGGDVNVTNVVEVSDD